MGIVKQHMAEEEGKNELAKDLLIGVGYLTRCERHEEIVYRAHNGEVEDAYKLGNSKWTQIGSAWADRRDMTDHIKAVAESSDYANDGCEICRGQMAKD
ncbi:MAG: hypothetical protein HYX42_21220 [Polaromonas sp.]|uniref:hypothetical protein n=1 Tax=Polaromonas sp. TaxID=1869339 RepID=UPI0025E8D4F3|nr:hypothetical protein [Polaromonas sp.]MBI2728770.1 hypothetical protein [Polaromonas sp.]